MRICAVMADMHLFEGRLNPHPVRLRLEFSDGSGLRLRIAGDGATLMLDGLPLEGPIDLGESGRVETRDVTAALESSLAAAEIGQPLLLEAGNARTVGLVLPRAGNTSFCIWIEDDEFFWGDDHALEAHVWSSGIGWEMK